jgi:hypothetical protein
MTELIEGGAATGSVVNLAAVRAAQAEARKAKTSQGDSLAANRDLELAYHIIAEFRQQQAGTDVKTPKPAERLPSRDVVFELLEPVYELFERYQQAKLEYDRAMAEVARRTGRDRMHLGALLRSVKQKRTARLEPEDWCNLM